MKSDGWRVEFDRMVERVADSRRQLVDQSFQAGFAELARGVLHNLGNAMTPIGVRLRHWASGCGRRRRARRAGRRRTAARHGGTGTARGPEEFMRLACGEFAVTIKAAQQDVAVLTRQTASCRRAVGADAIVPQ
jgi:two-component system NtrC family sensor kinase